MKALSVLGVALFMLTSLGVGLRLLALWSKTRKLPELLLAIALLCVGFLAYAVGTAGKLLLEASEHTRALLTLTGLSVECIGHIALVLFSWRVFYSKDAWARAVALLLCSLIIAAAAGEVLSGQYLRYSDSQLIVGPFVPLGLAARALAPTWMAISCLGFHGKLRRRLALGLADALVVHRTLLWAVGMGACALAYWGSVAHRLVFGSGLREHVWALSTVSFLATVSAVSLGIAFFPPAAYRRWAKGSAPD